MNLKASQKLADTLVSPKEKYYVLSKEMELPAGTNGSTNKIKKCNDYRNRKNIR